MGLALLNELQDHLHTAAIAGTQILPENFRLQKCIVQFAAIAPSAPVLTKIHQLLLSLTDSKSTNQNQALLDAIMLVDAVVCTQATNKIDGEISALPGKAVPIMAQTHRYSQLEPLYTALTTKGSGRYEIVRSAWEQHSPALNDFRLKSALIAALGDTYSEMADLIMEILLHENADLVPALKRTFDKQGKREMLHRLKIITALSGKQENEFYRSLLEGSSPDIRIGAIEALALSGENDELLIHLGETEKSNVKKAAWTALSELDTPSVAEFWLSKLKKTATTVPYITGNPSDALSDYVAEQLGNSLLSLLALPEGSKVDKHLYKALEKQTAAIVNKTSPKLFHLLRNFAEHRAHLASLRDEEGSPLMHASKINTSSIFFDKYLRCDIIDLLNEHLFCGIIKDPTRYEKLLGTLFAETNDAYLSAALALRFFTAPDKTYDEFQPYFAHKGAEKAILRCFDAIYYDRQKQGYYMSAHYMATPDKSIVLYAPLEPSLDIRWFQWLTTYTDSFSEKLLHLLRYDRNKSIRNTALLVRLYNPNDKELSSFLYPYFLEQAQHDLCHSKDEMLNPYPHPYQLEQSQYELYRALLAALRDCGEKNFSGLLAKYFTEKNNQNNCRSWEIERLCAELRIVPRDALTDLKKILVHMENSAIENGNYKFQAEDLRQLIQKIEAGACTTFEK